MQRSDIIVSLGKRIRTLRRARGLTLLKLASLCDISEKHLGDVERGKGNATIELLESIAKNLGVRIEELFPQNEILGQEEIIKELGQFLEKIDEKNLRRLYAFVKVWFEILP